MGARGWCFGMSEGSEGAREVKAYIRALHAAVSGESESQKTSNKDKQASLFTIVEA